MESIVLPVAPGVPPSGKPPVRIFLGTEPAQYRAERVFVWSIERVRDPGRVYEIHLMKDLAGFRPWGWTTRFTNYRFAIPELAGGVGRAIYNDVDQIYLSDPGELYDLHLGEHGYLAVSETDTSVMLMDCARMARFWTLRGARTRRKHGLVREALASPTTFGPLPPEWNARDAEYASGRSKLLHYTTLHKQPWRPFPERFSYQPNPQGELWFELETEADRAGFQAFGPGHSSRTHPLTPGTTSGLETRRPELGHRVRELAAGEDGASVLEITSGASDAPAAPGYTQETLAEAAAQADPRPTHDGVVCTEGLESLAAVDVPWVLDRIFGRARRFVLLAVQCAPRPHGRVLQPPAGSVGQPRWWTWALRSAAARRPDVHWELVTFEEGRAGKRRTRVHQGGAWPSEDPPQVWVLTDYKPGHTTQSVGLADALGLPYERVDLRFNAAAWAPLQLLGPTLLGLTRASRGRLSAPWPDLVITTGRRTAPVAGWIRQRSHARTRTVVMGRMGSSLLDEFDLAMAPAYAGLYPDPRRIDTVLPISRVRESALEAASTRWKSQLEQGHEPRIAVLVGGGSPAHRLTPEVARELGHRVADMARRAAGSVFVTTSRRTAPAAADALESALGDTVVHFHRWAPDQPPDENPFMGYLALADVLVATGDSSSMLGEACATGKPLYVLPLPRSSAGVRGLGHRLLRGVANGIRDRAFAQPTNRRGIARPQKRLERLCAVIVAQGWVRPSPDIEQLHESLFRKGLARPFDGSCELRPPRPYSEVEPFADRVRGLLGLPDPKEEP